MTETIYRYRFNGETEHYIFSEELGRKVYVRKEWAESRVTDGSASFEDVFWVDAVSDKWRPNKPTASPA